MRSKTAARDLARRRCPLQWNETGEPLVSTWQGTWVSGRRAGGATTLFVLLAMQEPRDYAGRTEHVRIWGIKRRDAGMSSAVAFDPSRPSLGLAKP